MPDVAEKEYDIPELVSIARKELPRWRNRMLGVRLWINPSAVYDHIAEQLCANAECSSKAMQVFGSADEPAKVRFKLTPDELAAFLKVVLDFIVQLLPLILPLFTKRSVAPVVALLIAVGILVTDAQAQCSGSSMASDGYTVQVVRGGLFSRLRARRQARISNRVSRSALAAQSYSSYGCSGSSAASYGCSGSAAVMYSYEMAPVVIESSAPNMSPAAVPVQQYDV